jgi:hypothetical protein
MSELLEIVNSISIILWSFVGVIGAIILLWSFWHIAQIVRNIKEYGNDRIGFMRGEIHKVAKVEQIEIIKPSLANKRTFTARLETWKESKKKGPIE